MRLEPAVGASVQQCQILGIDSEVQMRRAGRIAGIGDAAVQAQVRRAQAHAHIVELPVAPHGE